MIFITSGMGGGTSTVLLILLRAAKELNILTVTTYLWYEGPKRMKEQWQD